MDRKTDKMSVPVDFTASCAICQDLMPLVKDQVASEESAALVRSHLERCESCRQLFAFDSCAFQEVPQVNDQKVLSAVKRRLFLLEIGVLLLGSVLGVALSNSVGMFYNFTIMPLLGAVGLFTFPRRWYVVPIGILVLSYFWWLIGYAAGRASPGELPLGWLRPSIWLPLMLFLQLLGVAVAALLRFAFEKKSKENRAP